MNVWICDGQADCPDKDDEAICGEYKGRCTSYVL